ncbi:MAG: hypothetical protein EBS51_11135 [Planctomycetia bacterium]|nr:hypothetical protein [Planctomycetia bacterium]
MKSEKVRLSFQAQVMVNVRGAAPTRNGPTAVDPLLFSTSAAAGSPCRTSGAYMSGIVADIIERRSSVSGWNETPDRRSTRRSRRVAPRRS